MIGLYALGGALVTSLVALWFCIQVIQRTQAELQTSRARVRSLSKQLIEADEPNIPIDTQFVSNISHELRTPLTSIVGYLELLADGVGGELNPKQNEMLSTIGRNTRRLLMLIDDVLTLSKLESISGDTRVPIEVGQLVRNVEQAFLPSITERGLKATVDVAADTGFICGDIDQIERVFLNIVSNAVKFTPDGGEIAISTFRKGPDVCITVRDSGIGIPVEEQKQLFDRFFRSSNAKAGLIQGTGLGLAIVKSVIDLHDGKISIESAQDVGTTVTVHLPVFTDLKAQSSAFSPINK